MAIDQKWYKTSTSKLPSGDLFRIIAVFFDVIITLALVGSNLSEINTAHTDNDKIAQVACWAVFSSVYFLFGLILLLLKTGMIWCSIYKQTKDKKKKWEYFVSLLNFIMGALVIVMGSLYLFGENLPNSPLLCSKVHCRQIRTGLLGISLILNLFLTVVEKGFNWSGGWDKFKTVDDDRHKRWSDLLGLLSTVVLFDQALTGFYMTVYDIKMSSADITCDSHTHCISGATYGFSVILFIFLVVFVNYNKCLTNCCKKLLEDTNSDSEPSLCKKYCKCGGKSRCYWFEEICFLSVSILLVIFFILYIFADLPWPWNCKEIINSRTCKETRLAFLTISLFLVIIHLGLYILIVIIPSVIAFHQRRKSVVYNSKIKKLFGAQFRGKNTEVDEYCTYDHEGMEIMLKGDLNADQTTLSLPLSFEFEQDTECSLWCQAYDCCLCTRQCRDVVEDCVRPTDGDSSETAPLQSARNESAPYELNIGSALFATPKKNATVLFIDQACNRKLEEELKHFLAQKKISDVIIHSFSDSNQESHEAQQRS